MSVARVQDLHPPDVTDLPAGGGGDVDEVGSPPGRRSTTTCALVIDLTRRSNWPDCWASQRNNPVWIAPKPKPTKILGGSPMIVDDRE